MVRYIIVLHGYLGETTKFWETEVSELEKREDVELVAKGMCYDRQEKYIHVDYNIIDLNDHIKDFHLSSLIQSLNKDDSTDAPKIEIKKIKRQTINTGGRNKSAFKAIFKGLFSDGSRKDD